MKNKSLLTIVIPVFNEETTVEELVQRVIDIPVDGFDKEIIIVDDGSADGSPVLIKAIAKAHKGIVRTYTAPINLGKGAAVRVGFSMAKGDIVIVQDADLELDPSDIPNLVRPIANGEVDVVFGSRFQASSADVPLKIRLANRALVGLTNLLYRGKLTDMATGYKVLRREVLDSIQLRSARFEFEPEVTAKILLAGYRIREVPVTYLPRDEHAGKTIGWMDGVEYVVTLLKYRLMATRSR